METMLSIILILFCWGCLDYGMKRFAAWRRAEGEGPTINDHERRLKNEIGKFSGQHATLAWENRATDHFEKTGKVLERPTGPSGDINKSHWTNDSSYSGIPGNVFYIGNDE